MSDQKFPWPVRKKRKERREERVISSFLFPLSSFLAIGLFAFISIFGYHLLIQTRLFQNPDLTISAAISVSDALAEIDNLSPPDSNHSITYNLAASGKLRQQIEQGAPVDIYLSAGSNHMDILQGKNLIIPQTRQNLLKNRLVLIVPKNQNSHKIASFEDLLDPQIQLVAIGEPRTVPAGAYAAELLMNLGLDERLRSKLVFGNNVRQVLTFVETGNVDAGIVYITDAKSSTDVTAIQVAAENLHSPIIYPVAIVRESKNIPAAEEYLRLLFSQPARLVFEKYGFNLAS